MNKESPYGVQHYWSAVTVVACCPLVSYDAYVSVTDDDDRRQRQLLSDPLHYVQAGQ